MDAPTGPESPPNGFDPADVAPAPLRSGPWPIRSLALDVAGRCNLSCHYCAEAATQPPRGRMNRAALDDAWRLLAPDGVVPSGATIRLGSGEPLLALDLLQDLERRVKACETSAGATPEVFITSNGVLASSEVRDWLCESGWHVKFSLDGPADIHDRWRVRPDGRGTHEQVAAAAADLAERIPDRFSVTAVLCRGADPHAVFVGIEDLGVRRIELVPAVHEDVSVVPGEADVESYRRLLRWYVERLVEEALEEMPVLVRFCNVVVRVMGYDVRPIHCGAGRGFVGIDARGDIYPCFRFFGVSDYRLGDVARGIDESTRRGFEEGPGRPYPDREACAACWAAPLCGGPCFACSELFGNGEPLPYQCAYVLADSRAAVAYVSRLREECPERLLALLPFDSRSLLE